MAEPTSPPPEYWHRVEFLRRLEQITRETSLAELCDKLGISRATAYRLFWGERQASMATLRAAYRAYPNIFPELSILKED